MNGVSSLEVVLRSVLVGVAATLLDLGSLWGLVDGLGWEPVAANVPALLLGLCVQFGGNKWFAFRDPSGDLARQGAAFLLVEAGAFALNAVAFHLLTVLGGVGWAAARLGGSAVVYLGFSLPLWGRIFRPAGRTSALPTPAQMVR